MTSPRPFRASRVGGCLGLAAFVWAPVLPASSAAAEPRGAVELEPITPYYAPGSHFRNSLFVVGGTWGMGTRTVLPYVGAALGFYTAQARVGVSVYAHGLDGEGLLIRAEARPLLFFSPCLEPALLGNVGLGYHWPLEHSYPGEPAGAAMYLLPSLDAGPAWLRPKCAGASEPFQTKALLGGSVSLGIDW